MKVTASLKKLKDVELCKSYDFGLEDYSSFNLIPQKYPLLILGLKCF